MSRKYNLEPVKIRLVEREVHVCADTFHSHCMYYILVIEGPTPKSLNFYRCLCQVETRRAIRERDCPVALMKHRGECQCAISVEAPCASAGAVHPRHTRGRHPTRAVSGGGVDEG